MVEVHEGLYIGDETDCRSGSAELAVVHACKSPCHQQSVGYRGSLSSQHPEYLVLERPHDLYLNMIDPPLPLFQVETFTRFLSFARECHGQGRRLLIHCNKGESRSPNLALLFLSKHLRVIPGDEYSAAQAAFASLYAKYRPGAGIQQFLTSNWGLF
jgi:hypothetical protein